MCTCYSRLKIWYAENVLIKRQIYFLFFLGVCISSLTRYKQGKFAINTHFEIHSNAQYLAALWQVIFIKNHVHLPRSLPQPKMFWLRINWKTLKSTYLETLVRFVHKCYYDILPVSIQELSLKRSNVYNLWKQNCLFIPRPRTEIMKKSITYI